MAARKGRPLGNQAGFALVAAIIASLILLAIGMLVINLSTKDLVSSSVSVGNNKALAAVESGAHRLTQDFDPDPDTWTAGNNYSTNCSAAAPAYIWRTIAGGVDGNTQFAVCAPTRSNLAPVPIPGYALGSGGWGMVRYDTRIVGKNDSYGSQVSVDLGIGYGPVPIGTSSR
ncbi:MAG: hypothetical protein QM278_08765 [Pseudomonadota bacterium]|nr:hypothetical protein [Pseudomonadota bacterium]